MTDVNAQLNGLSAEEKRALAAQLLAKRFAGPKTVHPQSFQQQQWWYHSLMQPDSLALNVPFQMRITSRVNVSALQRAFQILVDRHAALRTTYTMLGGEPMQEVAARAEVAFEQVDASGWSDQELRERANAEHMRAFDLEKGPILRVTLFSRSEVDHVLFPVVHHIASDGMSLTIMLEELRQLYEALAADLPNPLPPQKTQYTDYVAWQFEMAGGPEGERHREYWQQQLEGELPQLDLPTDRPRVPNQEFIPLRHEFPLDPELAARLRALARERRTTLYTILLSALYVQLYRYSGQEDIVVGSPTAGRTRPEFENVVGAFSNPVLLRMHPSPTLTFVELIERVRPVVLEALEHQEYPFTLLLGDLRAKQSNKRDAIFNILFNLQRLERFGGFLQHHDPTAERATVAGLEIQRFDLDQAEEGTDIFMNLLESERTIIYRFRYNPELFDRETIERMQRHIETLLRGIADDPTCEIGRLPLLPEAERRQVLVDWNATEAEYPNDRRLQDLFEEQVERTPDAPALLFEGQTATFAELNARANQVAHHLLHLGLSPETPVGVYFRRSIEMVVAALGVLKAGGAYLPLDPGYPRERLAFMLDDARAGVVLTESSLRSELPGSNAQVICLDSDWPAISGESLENPAVAASSDSPAYVLYTSGSTGQPKGVLGVHRGAVNRFAWMWRTYPFRAGEVCCLITSLSFVDSVWALFGPLLQGVPVALVPEAVVGDPAALVVTLSSARVSRIVLVPSLLQALLENEPRLAEQLPNLQHWTCSGETLSVELARYFKTALPAAQLLNLYGSSEVAGDVTCCDTSTLDLESRSSVPIGRPIANTQLYLLDQQRQPVPIGVPGELYVGGANLARGYHNRPDLTAERFVPNPFSAEPSARLFRTGDRVRYRADGSLEYLGRVDDQIKVRGARIEPGEVESVLGAHPGVREVAVVAREERPGAARLVAYLVGADGGAPEPADLRAFLRGRLPEFMVPSTFVVLDELPLTPNGKLDRRALPASEPGRAGVADNLVPPSTPMELLVAEVWRDELELERIGVYDNFFDLGGHSLLAINCTTRLLRKTGIRLAPGILQTSTLGQVAGMYEAMQRRKSAEPAKPSGLAGQMFKAVKRLVGTRSE